MSYEILFKCKYSFFFAFLVLFYTSFMVLAIKLCCTIQKYNRLPAFDIYRHTVKTVSFVLLPIFGKMFIMLPQMITHPNSSHNIVKLNPINNIRFTTVAVDIFKSSCVSKIPLLGHCCNMYFPLQLFWHITKHFFLNILHRILV